MTPKSDLLSGLVVLAFCVANGRGFVTPPHSKIRFEDAKSSFATVFPYPAPLSLEMVKNPLQSLFDNLPLPSPVISISNNKKCLARDLVMSLVNDDRCFSTEPGAVAFGEACATDVVYEDCFEPKPFIGKEVRLPKAGAFFERALLLFVLDLMLTLTLSTLLLQKVGHNTYLEKSPAEKW